jgi:hypothetical protein
MNPPISEKQNIDWNRNYLLIDSRYLDMLLHNMVDRKLDFCYRN